VYYTFERAGGAAVRRVENIFGLIFCILHTFSLNASHCRHLRKKYEKGIQRNNGAPTYSYVLTPDQTTFRRAGFGPLNLC
jgi:hypothetical protein